MLNTLTKREVIRILSQEEVQMQIFFCTPFSYDDIEVILRILRGESGFIANLNHIRKIIEILEDETLQNRLSALSTLRKKNFMDIISELICYVHDHL